MSMSDARQFAELTERVGRLEARLHDLADRVEGKDVSDEVLGPVADEAARDGLRAMLKERRQQVATEADMPSPGLLESAGVDPRPEGTGEADPGLRDKLAALQGGDAAQSAPPKPGVRK